MPTVADDNTELKLAAFSPAASCAFLRHVLTPARCLHAVINAEINVNKQNGDPRKRLFKRRTLFFLHTSLKLGHTLTVSTDLFQELTTHMKIYAKACEYCTT